MEHRAEDRGSENVYAKYCMYIGCKWMYVYETIAVEFEGGYIGVYVELEG